VKIVGAGQDKINIGGIEVENSAWTLENAIKDFQSLDIGLYPLEETDFVSKEWILGKSGFKAIQYMSVGIPFVVSPVGVCAEIGIENKTHFSASGEEKWYDTIAKLLESFELRNEMGKEGRKYSLNHYSVPQQAEKIAETLHQAIENSQKTLSEISKIN
jgi:glycosyltransferase involved in cell wall biosynthesis